VAVPADIGIFTTDTALVVQSWDGWLAGASGIAPDRACGQRLDELVPDIVSRGLLGRFEEALTSGSVQVLAPAFHRFLIACPLRRPSSRFDRMQQRVTIGPLRNDEQIVGLMVTIEDVTPQLDAERDLADALASDDALRRQAASDAIAAAGRIESLEPFDPVLADENWQVRRAAVQSLARVADPEVVKSLLATLRAQHRDFSVLSSALRLLMLTDVDAVAPLAELLRSDDVDLRIQAALALGEQHDPAAIEPLLQALNDSDANVRFHAIEALGRLRAGAAADALVAIVETEDFFLAFAALDALALINDSTVAPRLVSLLENPNLRGAVVSALGSLGDEQAVLPLVRQFEEGSDATGAIAQALVSIHDRVEGQLDEGEHIGDIVRRGVSDAGRTRILDAISSADPDQLPALVRVLGWLRGSDVQRALAQLLGQPAVRADVIEALVRHGEGVVDLLVEQLGEADADSRLAAIAALGRLGSRRATPALVDLLDLDVDTMIAVAGALARIGDEQAFEPLLALVGHPNAAVRQSVIGALNSIGHAGMARRVAELVDDEDPLVRESAVRIAGYFGYRETTDALLARARDPHETVRVAALEHLPFLDDPRATTLLFEALAGDTPRARAAVARALARTDGPESLDGLISALADADHWVRYYAARGIGQRSDAAKAAPMLASLATNDSAPHVRIAAIDSIASADGRSSLDMLMACSRDADAEVAAAALRAIGALDSPDVMRILQDALRSADRKRRLAAIEGLVARADAEAVSALEWTASAESDPQVGRAAIAGIGQVAAKNSAGASAAVDALVALLGDSERRDDAVKAIGALPPIRIADVARGLSRTNPEIRRHVVDALGRFRHRDATGWLVDALQDEAAVVRETAVMGLMRLGARGVEARLQEIARGDSSKTVRRAAAAALAHRRSSP
jgi:HEAT repeat protein